MARIRDFIIQYSSMRVLVILCVYYLSQSYASGTGYYFY